MDLSTRTNVSKGVDKHAENLDLCVPQTVAVSPKLPNHDTTFESLHLDSNRLIFGDARASELRSIAMSAARLFNNTPRVHGAGRVPVRPR